MKSYFKKINPLKPKVYLIVTNQCTSKTGSVWSLLTYLTFVKYIIMYHVYNIMYTGWKINEPSMKIDFT